jgi:hypothetical protein
MAIDPLNLVNTPVQAPQPGLFDGQLVKKPEPPEVQIAGWGKAAKGIMAARKLLKEHELKSGEGVPFERTTPRAPDKKTDPTTLDPTPEIDPTTGQAPTARTPSPGEEAKFEDAIAKQEEALRAKKEKQQQEKVTTVIEKYRQFTDGTPYKPITDFNIDNLPDEKSVRALIAAQSEVYRKEISEQTGGKITHEVTRQMANLIGTTPDKLKKKLLGGEILHGKSPGEVTAHMLAARDLMVGMLDESDRLALLVHAGDTQKLAAAGFKTLEDASVAMERQFAVSAQIHAQVKGATTEIARAHSANRIGARNTALRAQAIGDILEASPLATAQERAAMYLSYDDPVKRAHFMRKSFGVNSFDALFEVFVTSILSNPLTHIVNFTGNLLFGASQIPTRTIAAMFGYMRRSATGATDGVQLGEDVGLILGAHFANWNAVKAAGLTFKNPGTELRKIESGQKFRMNAFSAEAFQKGGLIGKAIDLAGSALTMGRFSTRLLAASDVFSKTRAYQASIYADAFNRASREGIADHNLFAEAVADGIANPTLAAQQKALDYGRLVTFQSQLGPTGRHMQGIAAHRWVRWEVPFFRTPTNIISRAWDHTPFKVFSEDFRKSMAQGGEVADLAMARVALGTATMTAIGFAAKAGYVTGGGPSNHKLRANMKRQGWQPYSFKIGDTYYSFKRVEPFATLFGLTADLVEWGVSGKKHKDVEEAAAALGMSFAKNVASKTWMTGLNNLLDAIENPDRYGPEVIRGFIQAMVPRGVAQMEKVYDPEKKYVRTLLDVIRQDVPGWSDTLPADLNIWGEPIVYQIGGVISGMLNPIYSSKWEPNDLDSELHRLEIGFDKPPETIPYTGDKYLFKPWEYHDFAEHAGQLAKAKIKKVIDSSTYKDSNDLLKVLRIQGVYSAAKKEAWVWMLNESKHKDEMQKVREQANQSELSLLEESME